ncbi:MAG: alcohol dehydrogenase catalytic domain-containing protein [Actinomycetota bacterium]
MRAARLHSVGEGLSIDEIPEPVPGPNEVLVRIIHCGVCASDLHVRAGVTPPGRLPQILGHEAAGRVTSDAGGFREGEWVALFPGRWCGSCEFCQRGQPNRCMYGRFLGVDMDGAFAELVAVPTEGLIRIPAGVDPAHAAVATDAVATAFHALRRAGDLSGARVAVFGAGGVGIHAIMLAGPLGAAWVAAVDADPVARQRAAEMGAHVVVDPSDGKPGRAIRELSDGGVDFSFEFIGNPETISQSAKSLRKGGRAVLVGLTPEELRLIPAAAFVWSELEVVGSFGAAAGELEELMGMLSRGELDLARSITHRLTLEDADRALEMLRTREDHPLRIVLDIAPGDTGTPSSG